jgi:D-amino-acid dehydrogenase
MVGVSAALHLQQRGRTVVLVDRRGVAAEETSYGNAGLIQREGVVPYSFPHDWRKILRYALNRTTDAHLHYSALPFIAPWLFRYWRWSTPDQIAKSAAAMRPLVERCITEHEALMEPSGTAGMIRRTGYIRLYRSNATLDAAVKEDQEEKRLYGINSTALDAAAVRALEPHLEGAFVGGVHMTDPASVDDPGALGKAYADLFVKRGGTFRRGEARTLRPAGDGGWQVETADGTVTAREVVVALGPWSDLVLSAQGVRVPLGVKRGYHRHYRPRGNATLTRPVIDNDYGYALAPMRAGIRLTTGAEFALRDAPKTPVQLTRVEPIARDLFPLDGAVEAEPWMGRRPCLPDMVPMIGAVPGRAGLWADFGHHHLGFTLGPASGRLLAEMMTGETPFTDPNPYRVDRFS